MKSNILFYSPNRADATSFYRAWGPFGQLIKKNRDLNLITGVSEFSWPVFQMTDIFFMQRPFEQRHVMMAEMAKESRNKLWIDYDDDLFSVPADNPAHDLYGQESTQKNVAKLLALADVITVSTECLKQKLLPANPNIEVIPNALNDGLLSLWPEVKSDRKKIISWRGSNTHQKDLMVFVRELSELSNHPLAKNWHWNFIGYNPWFITESMNASNVHVTRSMDVIEYHKYMHQLKPMLHIVPLVDNEFNHSKSNIALLEAAWAGAVTLCPDWHEWKIPGALNYSSVDSFKKLLESFIEYGPEMNGTGVSQARQYIQEHLVTSIVNKKRMDVIQYLMESK